MLDKVAVGMSLRRLDDDGYTMSLALGSKGQPLKTCQRTTMRRAP